MADPSGTTAPNTSQTTSSANSNVNQATANRAKPASRAGAKKKSSIKKS